MKNTIDLDLEFYVCVHSSNDRNYLLLCSFSLGMDTISFIPFFTSVTCLNFITCDRTGLDFHRGMWLGETVGRKRIMQMFLSGVRNTIIGHSYLPVQKDDILYGSEY